MPSVSRNSLYQGGLILLLIWGLVFIGLVIGLQLVPRFKADEGEIQRRIFVQTCVPRSGAPLFTLARGEGAALTFRAAKAPAPGVGPLPDKLVPGQPRTVPLGDYLYRFRYDGDKVHWMLVGVQVRAGDAVGRAPEFLQTGRLKPALGCARSRGQRRFLSMWMDSMPTSAFEVLGNTGCGGKGGLCLRVTGPAGMISVERDTSGKTPPAVTFVHPRPGDEVRLAPRDTLWIGHVPLSVSAASRVTTTAEGGAAAWVLRVPDTYLHLRGRRSDLGRLLAHGAVEGPGDEPVVVHSVHALFKGSNLPDWRWSPEREDQYQLLIDQGLLCLGLVKEQGRIIPQLYWQDPADPGCPDLLPLLGGGTPAASTPTPTSTHKPLAAPAPAKKPPAIPTATSAATPAAPALSRRVLSIYRYRMAHDKLVHIANQRFRKDVHLRDLQGLPFTFEWWPVQLDAAKDRIARLPVRLWGISTFTTHTRLPVTPAEELPEAQRRRGPRNPPQVVLRKRRGDEQVLLARTVGGLRVYAEGDKLLGLGPLMGLRGTLDGLDQIVHRVPAPDKDKDEELADTVELTIDPELQGALWAALKRRLAGIPRASEGRNVFGVSAVALDPATGDTLAVLNWPGATTWESPAGMAELLTPPPGGRIRSSINRAMIRGDKVGSSMKVLSMYSMANTGVLRRGFSAAPSRADPGDPTCGRHRFGALYTDTAGKVSPLSRRGIKDAQPGPLPLGADSMRLGLRHATGESCNAFFGLAGAMLLGDEVPEVEYKRTCPVSGSLRRTDDTSAGKWVVCQGLTARASRRILRGERKPARTWLLLPPGEDLMARATRGWSKDAPAGGFYRQAVNLGYHFMYNRAGRGVDTLRLDKSYAGVPLRHDWFPLLKQGRRRVFSYPRMYSPAMHFRSGTVEEQHSGKGVKVNAVDLGWRDYASQVIGEAGKSSALGLAVLYTPAAREDGMAVAPRLVRAAGAKPALLPVFKKSSRSLTAIRQALSEPVATPHGTAKHLAAVARAGGFANTDGKLRFLGKTGTFSKAQAWKSLEPARKKREQELGSCGVPLLSAAGELTPRAGTPWGGWLGTRRCEGQGLLVTGVHRYPPAPAAAAARGGGTLVTEKFTSFATILLRPDSSGKVKAVVLALIADIPRTKASRIVGPLLTATWSWLK